VSSEPISASSIAVLLPEPPARRSLGLTALTASRSDSSVEPERPEPLRLTPAFLVLLAVRSDFLFDVFIAPDRWVALRLLAEADRC
jgi:hypothetical protein